MKLYDLVDSAKLAEHIQNRMVSEQRHPALPLRILNYTPKASPELKSLFFAMLDNKPQDVIDSIAWKMIKPRGNDKSFRTEE